METPTKFIKAPKFGQIVKVYTGFKSLFGTAQRVEVGKNENGKVREMVVVSLLDRTFPVEECDFCLDSSKVIIN